MTLTALGGFVIFFLTAQVGQSQKEWAVTYHKTEICAVKGSTVNIYCSYNYPSGTVSDKIWFTKGSNTEPVDLKNDKDYKGRLRYSRYGKSCTLTIIDVTESDSAEYKFRFITNRENGRYTGSPGVTLSVKEPMVEVKQSTWYSTPEIHCGTDCVFPRKPSYIWYKNGVQMSIRSSSMYVPWNARTDSYSCAIEGHENFPSPPVCIVGYTCTRVNYTERSVCAPIGSTVDISCTYNSAYHYITSKFWFRYQQHDDLQPQDLSEVSRYTGRVKISETEEQQSNLRITDLRESDSAQYRFKFTTAIFEWMSTLPGTNLTVTALKVQVIRLTVEHSQRRALFRCLSSCFPTHPSSYAWFINGQEQRTPHTISYEHMPSPGENISCAFRGHENHRSPSVYAPRDVLVSRNTSDEIMEGSSVMLTCSSDASPAPNYTFSWRNVNASFQFVSEGPELFFRSIQSSASGEYYCAAENELGWTKSSQHIFIDVKYLPKSASILVNSTGDVVEGSSVMLTCTSDANPEAHYTLNKGNQTLPLGPGGIYYFTSISPEDRGVYYCTSENAYGQTNSSSHFIDVQYSPRLPSVSVSPSSQIVEGSSMTLTCSSDANPAAFYTWYKEEEDSPVASRDVFNIAEFRHEHNGNYYCEAQNSRGHHRSISHHIALASSVTAAVSSSVTCVFLFVILLAVFLHIRRKTTSKQRVLIRQGRPNNKEQPDTGGVCRKPSVQEDNVVYTTVHFARNKNQDDNLYSNIVTVQLHRNKEEEDEEDNVEYSVVNYNCASATTGLQENEEDPTTLYSTVNKIPKM